MWFCLMHVYLVLSHRFDQNWIHIYRCALYAHVCKALAFTNMILSAQTPLVLMLDDVYMCMGLEWSLLCHYPTVLVMLFMHIQVGCLVFVSPLHVFRWQFWYCTYIYRCVCSPMLLTIRIDSTDIYVYMFICFSCTLLLWFQRYDYI